ncbi:hypothetical protein SEVIR_4G072166v4 [Setaria viridis]
MADMVKGEAVRVSVAHAGHQLPLAGDTDTSSGLGFHFSLGQRSASFPISSTSPVVFSPFLLPWLQSAYFAPAGRDGSRRKLCLASSCSRSEEAVEAEGALRGQGPALLGPRRGGARALRHARSDGLPLPAGPLRPADRRGGRGPARRGGAAAAVRGRAGARGAGGAARAVAAARLPRLGGGHPHLQPRHRRPPEDRRCPGHLHGVVAAYFGLFSGILFVALIASCAVVLFGKK